MDSHAFTQRRRLRSSSARRAVNQKILVFSLSIGAFGAALVAVVWLTTPYRALQHWQNINKRSLSQIACTDSECDSSQFSTNWEEKPDYVIDTKTRYFLWTPISSSENPQHFRSLDFVNADFINRFRKPASYATLDHETWRLYSREAALGGRTVEIIIGYEEKGPTNLISILPTQIQEADHKVEVEANRIADNLQQNAKLGSNLKISADGFAIVFADTREVLCWGPWLPIFLPEDKPFPRSGTHFYFDNAELSFVRTEVDGRLLAASLVPIGNLWWLTLLLVFAFIAGSVTTRALARRFMRNYFTVSIARIPSIGEALQNGEGQSIEFKRGISTEEFSTDGAATELLRSIAAFANTNDGAIFIGVDDYGAIKGMQLNHKQRDILERKIRTLARNHISPTPPIQITFEEVRGLVVAKVAVARGTASVHLLKGVVYVRYGSSDVQARHEDLTRLIEEYSF